MGVNLRVKVFYVNVFEGFLNIRTKTVQNTFSPPDRRCAVEICRTVFEDNPPGMDYNYHKHNKRRRKDKCTKNTARGTLWENNITGGFAMLERLAADTSVITYLMVAIGVLGVLAKIINSFTLHRLVKAAGNMPKSTHRLMKLVRAKYEHACMIRDSVENIDAFVEKYIYEYRGFLFRIHTWRQIEIISVWLAGILAALGASVLYFTSGFSEPVYQYIAAGIAEMVILWVVMHLTDEPYKVNAVRMYMADYLENICTFRLRRQSSRDRESIDVIAAEGNGKNVQSAEETAEYMKQEQRRKGRGGRNVRSSRNAGNAGELAYAGAGVPEETGRRKPADRTVRGADRYDRANTDFEEALAEADPGVRSASADSGRTDRNAPSGDLSGRNDRAAAGADGAGDGRERGLPISIEGEPRNREKGEAARQAARHAAHGGAEDERPALREEAIRQILEEFLA